MALPSYSSHPYLASSLSFSKSERPGALAVAAAAGGVSLETPVTGVMCGSSEDGCPSLLCSWISVYSYLYLYYHIHGVSTIQYHNHMLTATCILTSFLLFLCCPFLHNLLTQRLTGSIIFLGRTIHQSHVTLSLQAS